MRSLVGVTALLLSVGVLAGAVRSERTPQARESTQAAQGRVDVPRVNLAIPAVAQSRAAVWRQYSWQPGWQPPGPPQARQTPRYDRRFAYRDDAWRPWSSWRGPYDYGTRQSQRWHRQDHFGWRPDNRPNSRQDNPQGWRTPPRLRPRSDDHRWVGTPFDSNRMW